MKYFSVLLSLTISISISATVVLWDVQFAEEFGVNHDLAVAMFIQMEAIYIFFPYIRAMSYVAIDKKRSQVFYFLRKIFNKSPIVDLFEEIITNTINFFKWFASDKALLIYVFICIISPASLQVSKKFVDQQANKSIGVSEKPEKPDEKILTTLNGLIYNNDVESNNLKTVDEKVRNYYRINEISAENKEYKKQRTELIQYSIDYPKKLATYNEQIANKNTNTEKTKVTWFFDYFKICFSFIFIMILQYGSFKLTQKGAYNIGLITEELNEWNKKRKEKSTDNNTKSAAKRFIDRIKNKVLRPEKEPIGVNGILSELQYVQDRIDKREKFIESLNDENIASEYTEQTEPDNNEVDQDEAPNAPIQFEKIIPPPDLTLDSIKERSIKNQ